MADRVINVIFAVGPNGEFGHANGDLPWRHIKEDMQHFKQITEGTSVICGRKTWETIGNLPNRETIVVSSLLTAMIPLWRALWRKPPPRLHLNVPFGLSVAFL